MRQCGFTLVELVLLVAILGVIAAMAMPRFSDIHEEASRAKVEAVRGEFAVAVYLVRASWVAGGGFDEEVMVGHEYDGATVPVNESGWPCRRPEAGVATAAHLYDALMETSMPKGWRGKYRKKTNEFTYQLPGVGGFAYTPDDGVVR